MDRETILCAARVLQPAGWLEPGGVLVRAGRIAALGAPAELRARAPQAERVDVEGCALVPGLVNAHAHLELGGLEGRVPAGPDFASWVRAVVGLRAASTPAERGAAALAGAERCLASGTTSVGDLDGTGAAEAAFARPASDRARPRIVLFREVLDARDPARTGGEAARVDAPRERPAARDALLLPGLSPHAPHTVSAELLARVADVARRAGLPVAIHWEETGAERAWLEQGEGPFAALLRGSPRRSGLDLLEQAGLLGPRLALVHGNHARAEERARVAACGATLVHCPGSHAFFDRAPFDLRAWRAAGVRVALGTDSLASNAALDLRRELGLFARAHPWLDARALWDSATVHGARALGLPGAIGELAPGASADVLAVPAPELDSARAFERLARGEFEIRGAWLAGRLQTLSVPGAGCAGAGSIPG